MNAGGRGFEDRAVDPDGELHRQLARQPGVREHEVLVAVANAGVALPDRLVNAVLGNRADHVQLVGWRARIVELVAGVTAGTGIHGAAAFAGTAAGARTLAATAGA